MNNTKKTKKQEGWILKWAVIFIAIILILSYLGFDLESFIKSDQTTSNLDYVKNSIYDLWVNHGRDIFGLFYEHTKIIIDPLLSALKNPGSLTLQNSMPNFNTNLPSTK